MKIITKIFLNKAFHCKQQQQQKKYIYIKLIMLFFIFYLYSKQKYKLENSGIFLLSSCEKSFSCFVAATRTSAWVHERSKHREGHHSTFE